MREHNLRFPAEWEPQSAILLAWPHAQTDWAERLDRIEVCYTALIVAITRFQPVLLCVADQAVQAHSMARLAKAGAQMDRVRYAIVEYDDTWLRDSGPITLVSGSAAGQSRIESGAGSAANRTPLSGLSVGVAAGATDSAPAVPGTGDSAAHAAYLLLDFRFNAWGGKFAAARDDRLIESLFAQHVFGAARREPLDFVLEGGSVETDGCGTLLSTWHCLHKRHPDLAREHLGAKLCGYLRQQRVLWLDYGYMQGDDTDAHVDTLARFASPGSIVYQSCEDQDDTHFEELRAMAVELAGMRTIDDQPYRLFALPWAQPIHDQGRRLAASYANFLIINGAVLMPAYDDPADARAAAILAMAFPDREIVPVPCRPLLWQNGSLHCLSMQLPAGLV